MLIYERVRSLNGLGESWRRENVIARTHGLRFTVRNMGNDVFRVEEALLDPIGYLERDMERHGRYRIEIPFPIWMLDSVDAAMCSLGAVPSSYSDRLSSIAYARPIRDRVIEIIGWRHPSFFRLAEAAGIEPA